MVGFIKAILICISVSTASAGMTDKGNEITRCLPAEAPTLASVMQEILSENLSDIKDTFFIPVETEEESKMTQGVLILDATITSSEN